MKKRLQAHPISMRRILQVFAILIVLPLSFGGFLMWMLGLGVDDLTLQTVLLVSIFWFLVSYVPLMYHQLQREYPDEYKADSYNRKRSRADTVLGAGLIGLLFLIAQALLKSV